MLACQLNRVRKQLRAVFSSKQPSRSAVMATHAAPPPSRRGDAAATVTSVSAAGDGFFDGWFDACAIRMTFARAKGAGIRSLLSQCRLDHDELTDVI